MKLKYIIVVLLTGILFVTLSHYDFLKEENQMNNHMHTYATPMAEGIIREGEIKLEGLEFNTKFWAKDQIGRAHV